MKTQPRQRCEATGRGRMRGESRIRLRLGRHAAVAASRAVQQVVRRGGRVAAGRGIVGHVLVWVTGVRRRLLGEATRACSRRAV